MKKLKKRLSSALHNRFPSIGHLSSYRSNSGLTSDSLPHTVRSFDQISSGVCSAESISNISRDLSSSISLNDVNNVVCYDCKTVSTEPVPSYDLELAQQQQQQLKTQPKIDPKDIKYRKRGDVCVNDQNGYVNGVTTNVKREIQRGRRVHSVIALQESIDERVEPTDDAVQKAEDFFGSFATVRGADDVFSCSVSEQDMSSQAIAANRSNGYHHHQKIQTQSALQHNGHNHCSANHRHCHAQDVFRESSSDANIAAANNITMRPSSRSVSNSSKLYKSQQFVSSHVPSRSHSGGKYGNGHSHYALNKYNCLRSSSSIAAVVHEQPVIGSDGESFDGSGTSDEIITPDRIGGGINGAPVHVRMRPKPCRRLSEQDIQKRLSLPADLRLPQSVIDKLSKTPTLELDQPLTRKNRRVSLSEIGFGKLESYQKLEKLGEGTYATVYRGRSRLTNNIVALKEIRLEHEEGAPCTAIREVSLLRDLRHANVVTLHDIIHTDKCLTLVFEYLERDLKHYMDECGNILSMNNVRIFLFQLLRGLAYCHSRRVLHRDLKPQNLLINAKGELKLADFGLARVKSVPTKTYSNEVVTLWYRPPDVLLGSTDYSTHIDMWGVGCILYEIAAGRPFFPGSTPEEQLHLIFRALGTPSPELHGDLAMSPEFKDYGFPQYRAEPLVNHAPRLDVDGLDLLAKFLQYQGKKRLSARDAMRHNFFAVLGPQVHKLQDKPIFLVPGIQLTKDPGSRPGYHGNSGSGHGYSTGRYDSKARRQSMLL